MAKVSSLLHDGLVAPVSLCFVLFLLRVPDVLGAWLIHPVLIVAGKIVVDTIPGMQQEVSWLIVNLMYLGVRSPRTILRGSR